MKKNKGFVLALGLLIIVQFSGCIAFPPLITVKESPAGNNSRIDALEKRIERIEERLDKSKI